MKLFSIHILMALATVCAANIQAQDYPYDDAPTEKKEDTKLPVEKAETQPTGTQSAGSANEQPAVKKRYHSLFRTGVKVGTNYTFFQNPSTTNSTSTNQFTGVGFEGLISFGWDLPYQPIFVEFETGYRGILMTGGNEPLHTIPFTLGFHYRNRIARTTLWKPGLKSSYELRFTKNTSTGANIFSMNPNLSLSSLIEFENFLVEPLITLSRIQEQYNFIIFTLRAGYRF